MSSAPVETPACQARSRRVRRARLRQLEKLATARWSWGARRVQSAGRAAATTTVVARVPRTMQAISLVARGGGGVVVDHARAGARAESQPDRRGVANDVAVALLVVVGRAKAAPVDEYLGAGLGRCVEVAADAVVRFQQHRGKGARVGPYRPPSRRVGQLRLSRREPGDRPVGRRGGGLQPGEWSGIAGGLVTGMGSGRPAAACKTCPTRPA